MNIIDTEKLLGLVRRTGGLSVTHSDSINVSGQGNLPGQHKPKRVKPYRFTSVVPDGFTVDTAKCDYK